MVLSSNGREAKFILNPAHFACILKRPPNTTTITSKIVEFPSKQDWRERRVRAGLLLFALHMMSDRKGKRFFL